MRKRIKQLARGKFDDTKPELIFSEKELSFSVTEGEVYEGEFTFKSSPQIKLRGIVYATNPRMTVLTPLFEGEQVQIRYQFKSYGLSEGLIEKGDFVIICEQNEVSLSFCVSVSGKYMQTSIGPVKNLYDFSRLVKENREEAFQLFYHKDFSNVIKKNEVRERMLYTGIMAARPLHQNMEEFLIGIRKKDKVSFHIDRHLVTVSNVTEKILESVEIKKDHWGYLEICASADGDFIQIEKERIYSEDFIGSVYNFEFYINPQYLHSGRNFGRIALASVYEVLFIDVVVVTDAEHKRNEQRVEVKKYQADVVKLYQAYRLNRIGTATWAKDTIALLERLFELEPEEELYLLMKAQCLIINGQKQDAEWILTHFKRNWYDKKHPNWGYYLYLLTLVEREPNYVDRLIKEIKVLFRLNPNSSLLFWVLLFLDEDYIDHSVVKFRDIEYWGMQGCFSPYLYIEAFDLISQESYLLNKLETFELRVLRWAIRNGALTEGLATRIFQIMETAKGFQTELYHLMCAAYEINPKQEYAGIICSYLIRGQKFDYKYHKWYALGIEGELRITGLYEAYVCSMDEHRILPVPKLIQMYFQYESKLPYKKLAVLYNNIIVSKSTNPEIYQRYCRQMSKFAMEQILEGHMDDNLAMVYDDVLDLGVLNQQMAYALSNIIFTHKIVVYDKKMVRAFIYQRQMKEPQVVAIQENTAYFQLYSREYVIVFEDASGYRYSGSVAYQMQSLMDAQKYLDICMGLAPKQLPYLIAYFDTKPNYQTFVKEDQEYFQSVLESDCVSEYYKASMLPEILRFYQIRGMEDQMKEYLLKVDDALLGESSRRFVIELLIEHQMFPLAYEKVLQYGIDQIGSSAKAALAVYLIDKFVEEDEFTVQLALETFRVRKYNEKILDYLCKYYDGSTATMMEIWKAAAGYEIERKNLSERILVQCLYADGRVAEAREIFTYYYEHDGLDLIVLAYISYCAHANFVNKQYLHEDILRLIEARYIHHLELNDACMLALLKHYAEVTELSERQFVMEDELLAEYTRRNMLFAFYKYLHPDLVLKYHLYDKVFLEYRTSSRNHVILHYSRDEDGNNFIKEDMMHVYGGIFVKTFVMFFGEEIQYYICEEHQNEVEVTESNRIVNNDVYNKNENSRYNLLNKMLISNTLQEKEELYCVLKQYAEYDEVTKRVFKLL